MAQIVFENVSKIYGEQHALEDISLELEDGVTTAIIGASGSGKTTLLRLVNGLVRPDRGRFLLFGKEIDFTRLHESRRKLGYAVQGTGLFPHLSVWDNISLLAGLEGWSLSQTQERVDVLTRLVGLPLEFARRYPHELSGGQQQRVGLCRAMILNPPVLLLDEPFGALDPITRAEIHREFLKLQAFEPRTILLVTHDLREAKKLAQRVVLLHRGGVLQHGTFDHIEQNPANEIVRDFFQSQKGGIT
jgi:osmoprotectant transport system ATP-binding protein